ncbi:MAG: hypothetical protein H6500_01245 [Candidatus Woesearchaeota archaeon]|nr:hypothetical protein [Nanoarchaeota archaeon]USN44457.1 MAG: hypothetical protein H6500_01245 [Candidatus Woesearchaeota archaeon]
MTTIYYTPNGESLPEDKKSQLAHLQGTITQAFYFVGTIGKKVEFDEEKISKRHSGLEICILDEEGTTSTLDMFGIDTILGICNDAKIKPQDISQLTGRAVTLYSSTYRCYGFSL